MKTPKRIRKLIRNYLRSVYNCDAMIWRKQYNRIKKIQKSKG